MIVFLYGSDSYRLKQARDELVSRYKNKYKSGVNLFQIDLEEKDSREKLENAVKLSSFFNEHKLIVCKNLFAKKLISESALRLIKQYGISDEPDITFLTVENNPNKELLSKHKGLFEHLIKGKVVKEIEPLSGTKLMDWIQKETASRNCSIRPEALKELTILTGNDSWSIVNELDKLANYTNKITPSDIRFLVNSRTDMNIF